MTTVIDALSAEVSGRDLHVLKAIPRSEGHLLLELGGADGARTAGQWFADEQQAARVERQTRRAAPEGGVQRLGARVLLQPDGADRRLPHLTALAREPGASLVAHRPEQRGVVRRIARDGAATYTKLVRAKRFARTVGGARLRVPGVEVPRMIAADEASGTVSCATLPGRTLHELIADPRVSDAQLEEASTAVGRAVARLHGGPPTAASVMHDAAAEVAVTERWFSLVDQYATVDRLPSATGRLLGLARERLAGAPAPAVLLHRDLHDKQILVDGDRVGLLDFDLAASGEAPLDLANLLVHLELRALQGRCDERRAAACAAALLDGYGPNAGQWRERVAAYELTTRVRLACVYAFRPAQAAAGAALLDRADAG